jgi:hypothetical protein
MLFVLPFYKIFGPNPDIFSLTNIFYFFILLFAVYKVNQHLNGSGILSIIIILTFPVIIGYYRITHLVTATTAFLTLAIYFFIKSDFFENRKSTLIAGVLTGIGLLDDFHYLVYIIGPIIVCFWGGFLFRKSFQTRIKNFLIYILIVFLISSIWYLPALLIGNFKEILIVQFKPAYTYFGYIPYFKRLLNNMLHVNKLILISNSAVFLISIFIFYKKRQYFHIIISGWFLFSLLLLSFFSIPPNTRYLLPILPVISITIAFTLKELLKHSKKFVVFAFLCYFLFLILSFKLQYKSPQNSYQLLLTRNQYGILHPCKFDPKVKGLINFFKGRLNSRKAVMVTITSDSLNPAPLSIDLLNYKIKNSDLRLVNFSAMRFAVQNFDMDKIREIFSKAKYILYIKNNEKLVTTRPDYKPIINEQLKLLFTHCNKKLLGIFKDPNDFFIDDFYLYEKLD